MQAKLLHLPHIPARGASRPQIDLAGLQRVNDGQQASDLGTPVLFEGWKFANAMVQLLAGQEVEKGDEFITRAFTQANVGELTLDDKTYLARTYGATIGKATVTGYCIKFKTLSAINGGVLQKAIRYGMTFEATG